MKKKNLLTVMGNNLITTLPKQLLTTTPVVTEGFEDSTGFTFTGVGSAIETDTTTFIQGSASVKVTAAAVNTNLNKTVNWTLAGTSDSIAIFYYTTVPADLNSVILYLSNDSGFANYFSTLWQPPADGVVGWRCKMIPKTSWTATAGTPSWSSPIVRFRVANIVESGQSPVTSYDAFTTNIVAKPSVVIMFDDATESANTYGLPYLLSRKARATIYTISDNIDGAGYMTSAQLQAANTNGFDIANHSKTHTDFTTLTQGQQETEISTCKTVLDGLGLTRASDHVAFPYGLYDANTMAALSAQSMKSGRTVSSTVTLPTLPGYEIFTAPVPIYPAHSIGNETNLAQAKAHIDKTIAGQGTVFLLFHSLAATAANTTTWAISDFQALVDYIVTNKVQTLTISEFYNLGSDSIVVRHK